MEYNSFSTMIKMPKFGKDHQCLGSMDQYPHLQSHIPPDYDYVLCEYVNLPNYEDEERFVAVFRINIDTSEGANRWLHEFQSSSKTTWRVDKTYPTPQVKLVFKKDYHCQHNTRSSSHKDRNIKHSHKKNTNCPSKLTITVKKFSPKTKSEDVHLRTHATVVTLKQTHNHYVMAADSLRHRPVSSDVHTKFVDMFLAGLTPPRAIAQHQLDLRNTLGDEYSSASCDRYLNPDLNWCYRLYYKTMEIHRPLAITDEQIDNVEAKLRQCVETWCQKLRQKPRRFLLPVEQMIERSSKISNDSDLVTAFANFHSVVGNQQGCKTLLTEAELPPDKNFHEVVDEVPPVGSIPRKRFRSILKTFKKESDHDYSSASIGEMPVRNISHSNIMSNGFSLNLGYSSGMGGLGETWSTIMDHNNGGNIDSSVSLATLHALGDDKQDDIMQYSTEEVHQFESEHSEVCDVNCESAFDSDGGLQGFRFTTGEDPTHVMTVDCAVQAIDVNTSVAQLKELLKCF